MRGPRQPADNVQCRWRKVKASLQRVRTTNKLDFCVTFRFFYVDALICGFHTNVCKLRGGMRVLSSLQCYLFIDTRDTIF